MSASFRSIFWNSRNLAIFSYVLAHAFSGIRSSYFRTSCARHSSHSTVFASAWPRRLGSFCVDFPYELVFPALPFHLRVAILNVPLNSFSIWLGLFKSSVDSKAPSRI